MKYIFTLIFITIIHNSIFAQVGEVRYDSLYHLSPGDTIYLGYKVDSMAHFVGGETEMLNHINRYMHYPKDAIKNKINGRVWVSFIIETTGTISDLKIIKSLSSSYDKEAMDVFALTSNKWVPAYKNGKKVRSQYILPVNFSFK